MTNRMVLVGLCLAALALATTPVFFETYRTAAFDTIPHDDYAPYLLTLVGHGGAIPPAPFAYRILSVAVAIPFYFVLPLYNFTNLPDVDSAYLMAEEALAFASYLWLVLTSLVLYAVTRWRFGATRVAALVAAMTAFLLSGFVARTGVDPFAILVISLMLLVLEHPVAFGALALASIGINEKIPMLFATVLAVRFVWSAVERKRFPLGPQFVLTALAVAGYVVLRTVWKVPGNEEQTHPALFLSHLQASVSYSLSLKGLFLNVVPAAVVTMLAVVAIGARRGGTFQASDLSGLVVLVMLAGMADVIYNIGRIAMYAYPLFLPAAAGLTDGMRRIGTDSAPPRRERGPRRPSIGRRGPSAPRCAARRRALVAPPEPAPAVTRSSETPPGPERSGSRRRARLYLAAPVASQVCMRTARIRT